MYYIIYKITNQVDGKFYIGSHKTINLDDNYMGSGKYLKYAQDKYGVENFKKEILFVFSTAEEMYAKESEIVNEEFLATENTYNLKIGGFGGWDYANSNYNPALRKLNGKRTVAIARSKLTEKLKDPAYKQWHQERISLGRQNGKVSKGFSNKKHTLESKLKISRNCQGCQLGEKNSQYGTMWITNGKENKKIKKDIELIPAGWVKGRKIKGKD
jgi:hypothetical protein